MSRRPTVAFCYDFDGTLAPGNMQEHSFIPDLGMTVEEFWARTKESARRHDADEILAYLDLMLREAANRDVPVRKNDFAKRGRSLKLFAGVEDWFERINAHGKLRGLSVEHYVISSGIREMIEGSPIAKRFKKIFASSFMYNGSGVACWPALVVNYTTKTQYLFRINKGTLDTWDNSKINKYQPENERPIPFSRMIFIGDGETDIPCMKLVREQGGYAIAVYQQNRRKARANAQALIGQGRASFAVGADYTANSKLENIAKSILDKIAAGAALSKLSGDKAA